MLSLVQVPPGAIVHSGTGRAFWKETNNKDWQSARDDCISNGGDLAVLETLELFDFVKTQFGY